jgi:DNA modification methylase
MTQIASLIDYDDIPVDITDVNQSLLNIYERRRTNLFPWKGQFSPQFIEVLLNHYATVDSVVADPFLGSGTVLYECAFKNISSFGCELNPSAYYMASIYELCNLNHDERIELINSIELKLIYILRFNNLLDFLIKTTKNETYEIKNILSLFTISLDLFNNNLSIELIICKWSKLKNIILELPYTDKMITASLGDARKLNIDDNLIDLIITSPPYINVFNYHQKYRSSIESLGFDVLGIAKQEIGSNRKNRGNRFLTAVEYCIDMALSIREMIIISKPNARIILILGKESTILSLSFSNSRILYEIAAGIFGLPLILKQQRSFKNRFGQIIYEDILHFVKSDKIYNLEINFVIKSAKEIAHNILSEKLTKSSIESKQHSFLLSAIDKIQSLKYPDISI